MWFKIDIHTNQQKKPQTTKKGYLQSTEKLIIA